MPLLKMLLCYQTFSWCCVQAHESVIWTGDGCSVFCKQNNWSLIFNYIFLKKKIDKSTSVIQKRYTMRCTCQVLSYTKWTCYKRGPLFVVPGRTTYRTATIVATLTNMVKLALFCLIIIWNRQSLQCIPGRKIAFMKKITKEIYKVFLLPVVAGKRNLFWNYKWIIGKKSSNELSSQQ